MEQRGSEGKVLRAGGRLWRVATSNRLAIALLAALLLTAVAGTLFPQQPVDPLSREAWQTAVTLRYGAAAGVLQTLGLFDVYHAPWFRALLALLLANTLACTVDRLGRLRRTGTGALLLTRASTLSTHLGALLLLLALWLQATGSPGEGRGPAPGSSPTGWEPTLVPAVAGGLLLLLGSIVSLWLARPGSRRGEPGDGGLLPEPDTRDRQGAGIDG